MFHLQIVNIRVWKYVFTRVVIKIKIFHSCRTHVVRVALVSHLCRSCLTRVASVALVLYSCRSCLALVLLIRLDQISLVTLWSSWMQKVWNFNGKLIQNKLIDCIHWPPNTYFSFWSLETIIIPLPVYSLVVFTAICSKA